MNTPILSVEQIQKYYGNRGNLTKALDRLSFSVEPKEFLGIMGASGSGKTTLLNCISTIDTVTSGNIYIEGTDVTALRGARLSDFRSRKLGFIFQDYNLLDTLTAYENIALALSISKVRPGEIHGRVLSVADALNISDILQKYPFQMSGGQQQRVAAARAIVTHPALVLADEPTASCIYTQKGNKKIRKPQAANQTALIFDRRAAARLLSINSIRRLCWS